MGIRDWAREGAERERLEGEKFRAQHEREEAEKRERAHAAFREKFFALLTEWAARIGLGQWDDYWCETTADDGCRATFELDGVRFIATYEGYYHCWYDSWNGNDWDEMREYREPKLRVHLDRMGIRDVPEAAKAFQAIRSLTNLHEALTAFDEITEKYGDSAFPDKYKAVDRNPKGNWHLKALG